MVSWKNFFRGYATTTPTSVFNMFTGTTPSVAIRSINMANGTDTGATVKVWIVPSGYTPGDDFLIIPGWYLPPRNPKTGDSSVSQWTGFEVMSKSGDTIYLQASSNLTVSVSINGGVSK